MTDTPSARANRPLSPHLSVYRWQITNTLSILNRATGVALTIGTLLLVWWLVAAATGPDAFETVQGFLGSWIGQLMLLGWAWSLFYHLLNGIRHLVWDTGRGLTLPSVYASGWAVVGGSIGLTILAFVAAYALM